MAGEWDDFEKAPPASGESFDDFPLAGEISIDEAAANPPRQFALKAPADFTIPGPRSKFLESAAQLPNLHLGETQDEKIRRLSQILPITDDPAMAEDAQVYQLQKLTRQPAEAIRAWLPGTRTRWLAAGGSAEEFYRRYPAKAEVMLHDPQAAGMVREDEDISILERIGSFLSAATKAGEGVGNPSGTEPLLEASQRLEAIVSPATAPKEMVSRTVEKATSESSELSGAERIVGKGWSLNPAAFLTEKGAEGYGVDPEKTKKPLVSVETPGVPQALLEYEIKNLEASQVMNGAAEIAAVEGDSPAYRAALVRAQDARNAIGLPPDLKLGPIESTVALASPLLASQYESVIGSTVGRGAAKLAVKGAQLVPGFVGKVARNKVVEKGAQIVAGELGGAVMMYPKERGGEFAQFLELKTADGKPIDVKVAGLASRYGAAVVSLLDAEGSRQIVLASGPWGRKLAGLSKESQRGFIRALLTNKETAESFTKFLLATSRPVVKGAASEGGLEGLQDLVADLSGFFSKVFTGPEGEGRFGRLMAEASVAKPIESVASAAQTAASTFAGMGVIAAPGHAITLAQATTARQQALRRGGDVATLAGVATNSKTAHVAPKPVAKAIKTLMQQKGAEAPDAAYVTVEEAEKFFQAGGVADADIPAAIEQTLGPAAAASYHEATEGLNGGKIRIPMADYLSRAGPTGFADAMVQDTALAPADKTVRQARKDQAEIHEGAKRLAAEYEKADVPHASEAESIMVGAVESWLDSQKMLDEDGRRKVVSLWRALARTTAERFGLPEDVLFDTFTVEAMTKAGDKASPAKVSAQAAASRSIITSWRAKTPEARVRAFYEDRITGTLNPRGLDALIAEKKSPLMVVWDIAGGKAINDDRTTGGHEVLDQVFRGVAQTVHAEAPGRTGKQGGSIVALVGDRAEADRVIAAVQAAHPEKRVKLRAWVGPVTGTAKQTVKAIGEASKKAKDEQEAAGVWPKRGEAPAEWGGAVPAELAKDAARTTGTDITPAMRAAYEGLSDFQRASAIYVNQFSELLTNDGWETIREKGTRAVTASVDVDGLKALNKALGEDGADAVLDIFGRLVSRAGGADVDAAWLHGDEYAGQHDQEKPLRDFWEKVRREAADLYLEIDVGEGRIAVVDGVRFSFGTGATYAEADRNLVTEKQQRTDAGERGPEVDARSVRVVAAGELQGHRDEVRRRRALEGRGVAEVAGSNDADASVRRGVPEAARVARRGQSLSELAWRPADVLQKDTASAVREVLEQGPDDYGIAHRPPGPDDGAPLHDLTGGGNVYPDDIYGPNAAQYYGHFGGGNPMDRESIAIIWAMRGKPDAKVRIYRAVSDDITTADKIAKIEKEKAYILKHGKVSPSVETSLNSSAYYNKISEELDRLRALPPGDEEAVKINPGDWVTINRKYAKDHGESTLRGNYKIISMTVRAREVFTNGDSIHEFGYWPKGEKLYQKSSQTSTPAFKAWFRDSKVVDANGEPLVVQHVTDRDFASFSKRKRGEKTVGNANDAWIEATSKIGFWFASKAADTRWMPGDRAMPVFLSLSNPARFESLGDLAAAIESAGSAAKFTRALRQAGHDGIEVRDEEFGGTSFAAFEPTQVKSATGNQGTFDPTNPSILKQDGNEGARGWVEILRGAVNRTIRIVLTPDQDLSTILHESGHAYMEVLSSLSERADAPAQLKADWETAKTWMGVKPGEVVSREHAEKWARGFEAYLMEGKAPSAALARVFARFRSWLLQVYREIRNLNAPLDDEIRGVFDRLLATDEEIAAMRQRYEAQGPIFKTPEEAGMEATVYQEWLDQQEEAWGARRIAFQKRILKEQDKEARAAIRETRKKLKGEVEAAWDERPDVRAWALLERGRASEKESDLAKMLGAGKPIGIDRTSVVAILGSDAAVQAFGTNLVTEGGVYPDDLAEAFEQASGEALVREMAATPERDAWVKEETERRLSAEHPSLLEDARARREAMAGFVHSVGDSKAFEDELRAVRAKAGEEGAPIDYIKRAAKIIVARKAVAEVRPDRALQDELTAANEALRAAAKGNWKQVAVQKQRQLLAHFVWREMEAARKQAEALQTLGKRLQKGATRARLAKGGTAFLDGVDAILDALGVQDLPDVGRYPRGGLEGAVSAIERSGGSVMFDPDTVQEAMNQARREPEELTVEQQGAILDALKNIAKVGGEVSRAILGGKRVDKEELIGKLLAESQANLPRGKPPTEDAAKTWFQRMGSAFSGFDGALLRPARVLGWLGGTDADGVANIQSAWFQAFVLPMQRAKVEEARILREAVKPIIDAWEKMPKEVRARMQDSVDGAALFPNHTRNLQPPVKRFELLLMALNAGNDSNLQRLLEGRGITPEQLQQALDLLTREEMDWVQTVLDAAESLWPMAQALENRVAGVSPAKIEARPIVTVAGTFRGGYFPAVYAKGAGGFGNVGEVQAANDVAGFFDAMFARPGTQHSHLKGRAKEFAAPISFDPKVIQAHFAQVAHDLAFREAILSTAGLILDPRVQVELNRAIGPERAGQLRTWLEDVGRGRGGQPDKHAGFLDHLLGWSKGRMAVMTMGYAADIAAGDISNILVAAVELDKTHWAAGLSEYSLHPQKARAFALKMSGELRFRADRIVEDFREQVGAVGGRSTNPIIKHAWAFMEATDAATVTPFWLGAFRQAAAKGMSEADAVIWADAMVNKNFPSHSVVDMAPILRGKGPASALIFLHGFANTTYGVTRDQLHRVYVSLTGDEVGGERLKKVSTVSAKVTGHLLGYWVAYGVLGEFLSGRGPTDDDKDKDLSADEWVSWFLRKLVLAPAYSIPIFGAMVEGLVMGKPVSARSAPGLSLLERLIRQGVRVTEEGAGASEWIALGTAAAGAAGYPSVRPARAVDYVRKVLTGEVEPEGPLDFLGGVGYGDREGQGLNPAEAASRVLEE